ncbi:MAG: acetyl-CoA carboxylase, carboxyltransferase subunit beta [Flavobacteriales bacterium]|nr:acetyl-CoA carboxylase, carboxyltransferase subunit beta [Flavobacteriales bacterium]
MAWFKRQKSGILTSTEEKRETPEGLWHKCSRCKYICLTEEHAAQLWVCANCGYHDRIGSAQYFSILFDDNKYTIIAPGLRSADPLNFVDTKPYKERLRQAMESTGLKEAIEAAYGKLSGMPVVIACMDFEFIGGSMGSVVGEKIVRAADHCLRNKKPLIIISKSGGARMMEAPFSLMQMARTSAKLMELSEKRIPYISVLTNPTTGGVTASFAMLGDLNIAEPEALIGFAGPRVVKETIKRELPEGFQTAEFVLETGFLDKIVPRKQLKSFLHQVLTMFTANVK